MRSLHFPVRAAGLALLALTLPSVAAAQTPVRDCTGADLEGLRNEPVVVQEDTRALTDVDAVVAGRRYAAVIVRELAITDDRRPVDGTLTVVSAGLDLKPGTAGGRPAYRFTAPDRGPVRLEVLWLAERFGDPADVCQARSALSVPVERVQPVTVGDGRLLSGRRTLADAFELPLRAADLTDNRPVDVTIRVRTGSVKPPAARGPALVRATLKPDPSDSAGGFTGGRGLGPKWHRTLELHTEVDGDGVTIYADPNIAFGAVKRFAFVIDVRQGGARIGGYVSGARCRRVQLPDFSLVRCTAVRPRQL